MIRNVLMIVYSNYLTDARVRREAETLAKLDGYHVTVLALKQKNTARAFKIEGVQVVEVDEEKYDGKKKVKYILSYIRFFIHCFFNCTVRFLKGSINIVHVHNMPDFIVFTALVPRFFGIKLVLDIHDTMPETYATKFNNYSSLLFKFLSMEEKLSVAFSHKVICVNHIQRRKLMSRGIPAEKINVSLNVPDPHWFKTNILANVSVNKNESFDMIYHGTIAKRLGIDLIIRAVACLKNDIPGLKFHIWGKSGDELNAIVKLSHELGINGRIYIVEGGVPLEKLPHRLVNMSLGVIGNRNDNATELMLPVKMLEYIALGIPVVAPRLMTIQHYFDDEMVTYYEPENVDSMSEAILSIYQNRKRRQKQAVKAATFLETYGWQNHKMDLIRLYQNL